jgi:transposase-like protein
MSLSRELRDAIHARLESGASLSEIARGAMMAQSNLHRWYWDERKGLSLLNASKLCVYLRLRLAKQITTDSIT